MSRVAIGAVTINDTDIDSLPVAEQSGATFNTGQLAVTASAQQVVPSNTNRRVLLVTNTGAAAVFLGGSGVTITTGHALPAGAQASLLTTAAVYAIAAAGGNTLTYAELAT